MFGWRRKKAKFQKQGIYDKEFDIPRHFRCPISLDLMKDPVTLSSGITYDRESIEAWLDAGNFTCPVTNQVLRSFDQIPNHTLRKMIQEWCVENRNYGVERIPTPRIPVPPIEVSEILFRITTAKNRMDQVGCLESVQKIGNRAAESERNRRCIAANGAAPVLAAAFDGFSTEFEKNANLLEEILSVMNRMYPLDAESSLHLGSRSSLSGLVWLLKCRDLSVKQNAMTALKELLCFDPQFADPASAIDGVNETLFKFIKNPISNSITKSALTIIFHMVSSSSNSKIEYVELGLLTLLLEIAMESEKSLCEKALGVLNQLIHCKEGREDAYENALTIPVLVKKILRVSELVTEYSVSIIWMLGKSGRKYEEKVLIEALQVGAFQKLLLLLQVGCGDETKEKATDLLKMMNPYRGGLECIETVDFKNLKRSF